MYKSFFRRLADKEDGKFYYGEGNIAYHDGSRSPNVTFKVKFDYKDNHFIIINRTGTAYVAEITCILSKTIQPIEFEINNISHLKNLFLRKRNRLYIKSKNLNIKHFIEKNENYELLNRIADKDKFSPLVKCELEKKWDITAIYHLEFDNWTEPIEPMIALFKDIIDEFEKRIAHLGPKSYGEMN